MMHGHTNIAATYCECKLFSSDLSSYLVYLIRKMLLGMVRTRKFEIVRL